MRTTVDIFDDLMLDIKKASLERDQSVKELINMLLRMGLAQLESRREYKSYRVPTRSMGVERNIDLTKALDVAADLENEEIVRKLRLRK